MQEKKPLFSAPQGVDENDPSDNFKTVVASISIYSNIPKIFVMISIKEYFSDFSYNFILLIQLFYVLSSAIICSLYNHGSDFSSTNILVNIVLLLFSSLEWLSFQLLNQVIPLYQT